MFAQNQKNENGAASSLHSVREPLGSLEPSSNADRILELVKYGIDVLASMELVKFLSQPSQALAGNSPSDSQNPPNAEDQEAVKRQDRVNPCQSDGNKNFAQLDLFEPLG